MDKDLQYKIKQFVKQNIGYFHETRIKNIRDLKLKTLLENKNPYLFRAKNLNTATGFVSALLDARLSSSEEGSFGKFLESLAIKVAEECGGGQKSPAKGIDIDLVRGNVRYLISVKSGKNWGNSSQHKALKQDFADAVKVLKQSKHTGEIQPTLGICYGRAKKTNNGKFLHIAGQIFWHFLSDDSDLYKDIIEPLGYGAQSHEDTFKLERDNAQERMTREFVREFCDVTEAIEWSKLVSFVSGNLNPLKK
jgi:hypothetical protein